MLVRFWGTRGSLPVAQRSEAIGAKIARALVGNPALLVLDEAMSALDPATEVKIDENLRRRAESVTASPAQ